MIEGESESDVRSQAESLGEVIRAELGFTEPPVAEVPVPRRRSRTLDAAIEMIITRTRQFAVRQERWFRRDPRIRWIDIDSDPVATALPVLESAWQTSN